MRSLFSSLSFFLSLSLSLSLSLLSFPAEIRREIAVASAVTLVAPKLPMLLLVVQFTIHITFQNI